MLDASSHLYKRVGTSVRPSVSPSVRLSVTRLSKSREIDIFEQIRGGIHCIQSRQHEDKLLALWALLKTVKPKPTKTGSSGISSYRYRYRSAGS